MTVILLTGMSAVGKSTVVRALRSRGHHAVDTDDDPGYLHVGVLPGRREPERLWREDVVTRLLDSHAGGTLFLAGTVANQGSFYGRLDAVVLLSVPRDVLLDRLAHRTTNDFGRSADERERVLRDLADVEPLLRAGASTEIDTRRPLAEVVATLEALAAGGPAVAARRGRGDRTPHSPG